MADAIRVLLVDEPSVVERTRAALEGGLDGVAVTAVTDAATARERLDDGRFDCVVSGHVPPDLDGLALLDAVREHRPALPFVLAPASGSESLAAAALDQGATAYVTREEDDIPDLAERVERAVTDHRATASRPPNIERLLGAASDVLFVLDAEARHRYVSPAVERVLGHDPSALVGEDWFEFVHPEDRAAARAAFDRLADGDDEVTLEVRTEHADRGWPVLEHRVRNPLDTPGVEGFVVTAREVTARSEYETKLDRLRERSQALMYTETREETARVAVEAADEIIGAPLSGLHLVNETGDALEPAAVVNSVHDAFEEPLRYPRDAEPGTRAAIVWGVFERGESLHIDDVAAYEPLEESTPAGSVVLEPVGDHGIFVVSSAERGAFDETDRVLVEILATSLSTAMDRVEREQRLRTRQRRLERLHDATRELMEARTRQEIADRTVAAAEEILEFPIVLVRFYDPDAGGLVPAAQSDSVAELLPSRPVFTPDGESRNWEAYEDGEPKLFDDVAELDRAADAGTSLRSLMLLPLGEHGTLSAGDTAPESFDDSDVFLAGILATAAETALDRADREIELRRRRDELERQNERLDEFASIVSHDLRNPLQVADGWLELVREDDDSEELAAVARAHDRMRELIEELLEMARDGSVVTETEPVELGALAERCWRSVDTTAAALDIETDRVVTADAPRLQQLIENLLANAVRHGRPDDTAMDADGDDGHPPVTVTIGDLADGFYVEDDGPGIPEDERGRVFESGYSTDPDGTGFGLRIVRQVARAHGWTVDVTEGTDGGARFEVRGVEFADDGA